MCQRITVRLSAPNCRPSQVRRRLAPAACRWARATRLASHPPSPSAPTLHPTTPRQQWHMALESPTVPSTRTPPSRERRLQGAAAATPACSFLDQPACTLLLNPTCHAPAVAMRHAPPIPQPCCLQVVGAQRRHLVQVRGHARQLPCCDHRSTREHGRMGRWRVSQTLASVAHG